MPNTTNFNWPTPADTDLVKDGAAAIRNLGNGIDTSLIDLKGGTTGQILSKASNADMDFTFITPNVGDITEVQAGTGISVASGTGPIPVVTNSMATEITAKGDLIVGTGSGTFDNLPAGTNGHILVCDSVETTGLKWAAPASDSFTLIASGTLSSAGPSFTSIPATYKYLVLNINNVQVSTGAGIGPRINNITTASLHRTYGFISNGASITNGTAADTFFTLSQGGNLDTGSNENNFVIYFPNYYSTTGKTIINYVGYWKAFGVPIASTGAGYLNDTAAAVNRIDFITGAGTFSGGTYELFGVK